MIITVSLYKKKERAAQRISTFLQQEYPKLRNYESATVTFETMEILTATSIELSSVAHSWFNEHQTQGTVGEANSTHINLLSNDSLEFDYTLTKEKTTVTFTVRTAESNELFLCWLLDFCQALQKRLEAN